MSKGSLTFVAGEVQTIKFTLTYKSDASVVDVSSGNTCSLLVSKTGVEHFSKVDGDFDKGEGASGILTVLCPFLTEGLYDGILTVVFGGGTTKKHLFGIKVKGID